MLPDNDTNNKIHEFVKRAREAAGSNLESVILFGSAASGDFHPGQSDVNLLCVLKSTAFAVLQTLGPVAKWWDAQKQPAPLCMTREELDRSTDVFTIELLDMQQHHRVLFGDDVVQNLKVPMDLHRVQVEYELREKLILLRQKLLLLSENDKDLWTLLLNSVPSFATLFRHALIALSGSAPLGRSEAVQALAKKLALDASAFDQVMNARERKTDRKGVDVRDLVGRYATTIEQVVSAVDQALDSDAPGRL